MRPSPAPPWDSRPRYYPFFRKYSEPIGDYNPKAHLGRMPLRSVVLHVARLDVMLQGQDVVEKGVVAKAFTALHPK